MDIVYHFASPASPVDYLELPLETLKVGSYGTHNTLELARQKGARFLVASTSEVYGDPTVHPQPEEYWGNVNPNGTRAVYDEAKRYAEAVTFAYRRLYGMDAKIVRIFNTYGPRMRINDGRVVPAFISQALRGEDADGLRGRHADALVLLRVGFDRRHLQAERLRAERPDQCRQPVKRADHDPDRRRDYQGHRQQKQDDPCADADGG